MRRSNSNTNSGLTKGQVKQMIKANTQREWNKKYILTNLGVPGSSQSVDATGVVASLTTVAQGSTQQTRIGNYARLRRIWGNVSMYADSSDIQNSIRQLVVAWTDAAPLSVSDVLVSATAYHTCYYNLNNIENGKLKILSDTRVGVNYSGSGPKTLKIDMKVDMPLQWSSTGSAAPITNAIYVIYVSDSSLATHPYVQSSFCCQLDNE